MAIRISGKLTQSSGDQGSFDGCRIDAVLDERAASAPRPPMVFTDDAGAFTFVFPDHDELPGETIEFVVVSPHGHVIGRRQFLASELGEHIDIDVDHVAPPPRDESPTPERTVIDGTFKADAHLRRSLSESLQPLRAESDAIDERVEQAFASFRSTALPVPQLASRRYVEPDVDPGEMQEKVITAGAKAMASAASSRTMRLRKSPGLDSLIAKADGDGGDAVGQIDLSALIGYVNERSKGPLTAEPVYTRCRAEMQADAILAAVENKPAGNNGTSALIEKGPSPEARDVDQLVHDAVNLQMHSATSPEARLDYGSMPVIPNASGSDAAQKGLLQTFELRPGASDVTSYHDFHTLQIAFEHVWTRIFDVQLTSLGRDLYREYVKLKDMSGAGGPDLTVSTADDLRRLMDEVKRLSEIVQSDLPPELVGGGKSKPGETKGADDVKHDVKTAVDVATGIVTGGVSWLLQLAVDAFSKAGNKPIIRWEDFPGPWAPRHDKIYLTVENNVVPTGHVEVVLKTDYGSHRKIIEFEPLDPQTNQIAHGPRISTAGDGSLSTLSLRTDQIATGVLEFASEETLAYDLGRYVLADLPARLKDGTRVTFYWRDN